MSLCRFRITRREFLKAAGIGAASLALPSCVSRPGQQHPAVVPFTFAQICDTQLGMGGYDHDLESFRQAVTRINALNPDFVVICGDLVNSPDAKSFADFNEIKARFSVPCYCAPGNHDVGGNPTLESLRNYRKVVGADYYSCEHGGCVFVIVNTQLWKSPVEGESGAHDSWLESTLRAAAGRNAPIFVVGHYPLFLEQADEDEEYMNLPVAKRGQLLALFEKQGVVAMLGGHTHRLVINDCRGIQLVNGETTSKNFDERPLGFRLWRVVPDQRPTHTFVPLEDVRP